MRSSAHHVTNDDASMRPFIAVPIPFGMIFTSIIFARSFAALELFPTATIKWLVSSNATRVDKNGTQCADILAWAYLPLYQMRNGSLPKDYSELPPCLPLDADEMCRRIGRRLSRLNAEADKIFVAQGAKWKPKHLSTWKQVVQQYENPNFYANRILQWASHYRALRYEHVIPKYFGKATVPFKPMVGNVMVPMENKHAI